MSPVITEEFDIRDYKRDPQGLTRSGPFNTCAYRVYERKNLEHFLAETYIFNVDCIALGWVGKNLSDILTLLSQNKAFLPSLKGISIGDFPATVRICLYKQND